MHGNDPREGCVEGGLDESTDLDHHRRGRGRSPRDLAGRECAGARHPPAGAKPARTITVSSTATVKAAPDEAVVDLAVQSESSESADAFAQSTKDMQAVLDAVQAAGVEERDIQTTNVSLEQRVTNRAEPNEQQAFLASNSIRGHDPCLSSVDSVIDAAVRAGAGRSHHPVPAR
jgi:uncharacterized protein YggE